MKIVFLKIENLKLPEVPNVISISIYKSIFQKKSNLEVAVVS